MMPKSRLRPGVVRVAVVLTFGLAAVATGLVPPAVAAPTGSGSPMGWGYNGWGQVGDGTTALRNTATQVSGLSYVAAVAGGYYHSLALKPDGTVMAWGYNLDGELGQGTTDVNPHPVPAMVTGLSGVTAIAAGAYHSLALKADGTVWAWGWNDKGQLGNGNTTSQATPAQVPGLDQVVAVSAGFRHSLALKADGTVWAWGYNAEGQLGDGTTADRLAPVQVTGVVSVTGIAAGWFHSLAWEADGSAWAWGANWDGELGNGSVDGNVNLAHPVPGAVIGLATGVQRLAAGAYHTLALKADGTLWAWGRNLQGQLGDGTTSSVPVPETVPSLANVAYMAGGWGHSLAVTGEGRVWAWGLDDAGQLGDGHSTMTAAASNPLPGAPATPAVPGDWAWGQQGVRSPSADGLQASGTYYRASPGLVLGLTRASAVAAGYYHSLAISARPPWDVNGDGVVDIADVSLVGLHYGETGAPGWIPEDVNQDGVVDIADVSLIGFHWGETY